MWNLCWTDSIIGVDFCREMRRFQRINVSILMKVRFLIKFIETFFYSALSRHVRDLPQGSVSSKSQSNAENLSRRLQYFP